MMTVDVIKVNAHEAKLNFSSLITHLANGKEIIITRSGREFAHISPIKDTVHKRISGRDKNTGWVSDTFNEPLPAELQKYFE